MAITNWVDYSKAPLIDAPGKDLFEDVLKGYKIAKEPAKMEQDSKAKELANALHAKALEHKDEEWELNKAYKQALTNKANRPTASSGGTIKPNAAVANAEYIWRQKHPIDKPLTPEEEIEHNNLLQKAFETGQEHISTLTSRTKDITAGTPYDKLPVDEKKRAIGLTTAMGIDPIEGAKLLRSGKSLQDIADDNNVDLATLDPIYPPAGENVKQTQRRTGFASELKNLEDNIVGAMGEYQNKLFGYSLEQIADASSGEDPDKQGKVLAARALQPELASLRLKVMGGNIGIEAIRELQSKSLGNLKIIEPLVSPKAYLAMQKYMTKWLTEAADKQNKTIMEYGRLKTREQIAAERENKSAESEAKAGKVYNLATRSWEDE